MSQKPQKTKLLQAAKPGSGEASRAKRGRPKTPRDDQSVRKDLLEAAKSCLLTSSYHTISTRQIADVANSNVAMIRYYFGNKLGLFSELIETSTELAISESQAITALAAVPAERRTAIVVESLIKNNFEQPWLIRLIIDDLMNCDVELREMFLQKAVSRSSRLILAFIDLQISDGHFRTDIDKYFTQMSLLSITTFPFLTASVSREGFSFDIHSIDIELWIEHCVRVFESGVKH